MERTIPERTVERGTVEREERSVERRGEHLRGKRGQFGIYIEKRVESNRKSTSVSMEVLITGSENRSKQLLES